jgi:alpha-beta hydrolase superfamily lysophospholipase
MAKYNSKIFFSKRLLDEECRDLALKIQPESKKAEIEMHRQIVPESIRTKIPVLVLGSKNDFIISEKDIIKTGKTYQTRPVIFSNICHDMMLDPDWQVVADEILTFITGLGK